MFQVSKLISLTGLLGSFELSLEISSNKSEVSVEFKLYEAAILEYGEVSFCIIELVKEFAFCDNNKEVSSLLSKLFVIILHFAELITVEYNSLHVGITSNKFKTKKK